VDSVATPLGGVLGERLRMVSPNPESERDLR
jgi:hypothetical protein